VSPGSRAPYFTAADWQLVDLATLASGTQFTPGRIAPHPGVIYEW
jgi:hypothetical protein